MTKLYLLYKLSLKFITLNIIKGALENISLKRKKKHVSNLCSLPKKLGKETCWDY
jgi:hypothetical protein